MPATGGAAGASPRFPVPLAPPRTAAARPRRPRASPAALPSAPPSAPPSAAPPTTALVPSTRAPSDGPPPPPPNPLDDADGPADYYALLDVAHDASVEEIRAAYRRLQKACHPDVAGDDGAACSALLNLAVAVLSDGAQRRRYDDLLRAARLDSGAPPAPGLRAYTGEPFSAWRGRDPKAAGGGEWDQRAVFVDEGTCIGCKNCSACAANTFAMEPDWGRARAFAQWADSEADIQCAIDSCPVDCIAWVGKADLPVLEYVMQGALGGRDGIGA